MSYEKLYVLLYFYRKYVLRNAQYMYVLYTNGLIFSLLFVIVGRSSDGSESTYARNKLFLGPGSNLAQAQLFKKGPSLELFGFCVYLVNIWDLERCYGQHSSGSIFWEALLSLIHVKLMTFKAWDLHTRLCLLKAGRITRKKYLPE